MKCTVITLPIIAPLNWASSIEIVIVPSMQYQTTTNYLMESTLFGEHYKIYPHSNKLSGDIIFLNRTTIDNATLNILCDIIGRDMFMTILDMFEN